MKPERAWMIRKRWVHLLVVVTLLASTGRAAAVGPTRLPTVRGEANTAPVSAPQTEASGLAVGIVNRTLLSQGFPSADMPPPGWIVQTTNYTRTWVIVDATNYPTYVHSGPYAAWVNWDLNLQDEWLYTPPITMPLSLTDAKLSFWAYTDTDPIFNKATVTVFIVDAQGVTTEIWKLTDEIWPIRYYRQVQYDLTPFIGQTIKIAWQYLGYDGQSFGLDDIEISGNAEGIWLPIVLKQN